MLGKKVIALVLVLLFSVAMVLTPCIRAQADSFPSEFYVDSEVYYSPEALFIAYEELTDTQEDICSYLLGMYNLMYLGSRGFSFKQGAYRDESTFIAKVRMLGYQIFQRGAEVTLRSRMNADFCKYASACVLYSSLCNVQSFEDWFENLDEDFILPVDRGLLNSFTLLYNDNDYQSISQFGDMVSPWNSGILYDFAYNGHENSGSVLTTINVKAADFDFVVYSKNYNPSGVYLQSVLFTNYLPDTLFIQRSGAGYRGARYGRFYSDSFHLLNFEYFDALLMNDSGASIYYTEWRTGMHYRSDSFADVLYADLSDYIDYIFDHFSPIQGLPTNFNNGWIGAYPFIRHVVLVDNLSSLSNPVEVFNTDSWDLINHRNNMIVPIDTVNMKPKVITTINLPDNTSSTVEIQDIIDYTNVVDDNGDNVNPWQINVIVQPNDTNPISVDVNMFNGGTSYIDYLWAHTMKMAQYSKDLLDCFDFSTAGGDSYGPKFAVYGVLVLGIAGGLVAKFLL